MVAEHLVHVALIGGAAVAFVIFVVVDALRHAAERRAGRRGSGG